MNTITFRTHDQKVLFDHELRGQLSDGHWGDTTPHDHWKPWCQAETVVGPDVGVNFWARKSNYNFLAGDLLDVVEGRMRRAVIVARLFGADAIDLVSSLYGACGAEAWSGLPRYEGEYWDKKRAAIQALADKFQIDVDRIERIMIEEERSYTSADLRRDLKEMMVAIRTRA